MSSQVEATNIALLQVATDLLRLDGVRYFEKEQYIAVHGSALRFLVKKHSGRDWETKTYIT
jgi:hypothetical protein